MLVAASVAGVEDLGDVLRVDGAGGPGLALEPLHQLRVPGELRPQDHLMATRRPVPVCSAS